MADKIIKATKTMVCSRYQTAMTMAGNAPDVKASCYYCEFHKSENDKNICTNQKGNPKPITYKSILDPNNMLCHKFNPNFSKIQKKHTNINVGSFANALSKVQKGKVINKEDFIPVCSFCNYCNGRGCRLGMHPRQVTEENQGKTKVVYDIQGKLG